MVQKVAIRSGVRDWALPCDNWKNSLCQPSSKCVPFSNQERIRQGKEKAGLGLSSAVPKIQWDSNSHCPYCYYRL